MKLTADIFRHAYSDTTKNGVSFRFDSVVCHFVSEHDSGMDASGYPDNEETRIIAAGLPEEDFIIIDDVICGNRRVRAIPCGLYAKKRWTMFGGNFAWTSDSRFFSSPVKIHDRVETTND